MPRLFVLTGPDVGLEKEVGEGAVIGRGEECEVRLRDASVSRRHARLERRGEGFELVDLGSRNGLARGGARAERIALAHGEEFFVGSVRMRFLAAEAADVEEIELALGGEAPEAVGGGGSVGSAGTAGAPAGRPGAPRAAAKPNVAVGAARRRAIAQSQGVLQFERIEGRDASLLRDDLSQQNPLLRWALVLAALLTAAALFYGAYRLAAAATPEGGAAAARSDAAPAGDAASSGSR